RRVGCPGALRMHVPTLSRARVPGTRARRGGSDALDAAAYVAVVGDPSERIAVRDVRQLVLVPAVDRERAIVARRGRDAEAVRHPRVARRELRADPRGEGERPPPRRDADGVAVADAEGLRVGGRDVEGAVRPATLAPARVALDRVRGPA